MLYIYILKKVDSIFMVWKKTQKVNMKWVWK